MESIPLIDRRQHGFSGSKSSQIPVGKQKRGLPRPQACFCPPGSTAHPFEAPSPERSAGEIRPAETAAAVSRSAGAFFSAPADGGGRGGCTERCNFIVQKGGFAHAKPPFSSKLSPCFCPPLTRTGPLPRTGTASSCGRGSGSAWPRNSSYCPPPYTTTPP